MNKELMKRISDLLKTKSADLGFNSEELGDVANNIYGAISPKDGEEVTDEAINAQIDAVLPILRLSQKAANRIVNAEKKKFEDANKKKPDDTKTPPVEEPKDNDKFEKLMKKFEELEKSNNERWEQLSKTNITTSRRAQLEELLKDSGEFGKRVLKSFSRMSFADDDDFKEFIEETKASMEAYEKEVKKVNVPPAGAGGSNVDPSNPMTDDEVKELADMY